MADNQERDESSEWDLEWDPIDGDDAPSRPSPGRGAIYAEFPLRGLAFIIDLSLALVIGTLMSGTLGLIAAWFNRQPGANPDTTLLGASLSHAVLSILFTLVFLYFWRTYSATPGQLLLRLMVVRADTGQRLRRGSTVVRWLLLYLPMAFVMAYQTLGTALARIPATEQVDQFLIAGGALFLPLIWWLVLTLSVAFDRRRGRGLHDRAAGSVVIRRL